MNAWLETVRQGACPDFAAFVRELGPALPLLDQLAGTPQDPQWHAEGDVATHTGMVLGEAYALAAAHALGADARLTLVLAAALHDIGKALTTRTVPTNDGVPGDDGPRVISPRHADRGRSYLSYRLPELALPWAVVRGVLALVGHHHDLTRTLETGTRPAYRRLARQVDLRLLYLLELADVRGRVTADRAARLDDVALFRLQAEDFGLWPAPGASTDPCTDPYADWQAEIQAALPDQTVDGQPAAYLDLAVQNGILDYEAGLIQVPGEAVARAYRARRGFPQLVVTCGPSGAGKSAWVGERLPTYTVVSLDALRDELAGKRAEQGLNGQVLQAAKEQLRVALRRGGQVVWDATNLRHDFRRVPLSLGLDYGALTTLVVFQPPVSTVFQRNPARLHAVPPQVLAAQIEHAEFPYLPEAHRTLLLDEYHRETFRTGFTGAGL